MKSTPIIEQNILFDSKTKAKIIYTVSSIAKICTMSEIKNNGQANGLFHCRNLSYLRTCLHKLKSTQQGL